MKWEELLIKVADMPVIETESLLAGITDQRALKVQISRWHKAGNLIQVKRGLYVLSEPYRKREVYEFYLASILMKPSYISLEKALEYYGLIPEAVPTYTSVTTKRPCRFVRDKWVFDYRHIKNELFWGYSSITVNKQTAFMAYPEKALLDLCYFKGREISAKYLGGMRLQNVGKIDIDRLLTFAEKFNRPGIITAARLIKEYITSYKEEEQTL